MPDNETQRALETVLTENPELAELVVSGEIDDLVAAIRVAGKSFDEQELRDTISNAIEQNKMPLSDNAMDEVVGGTSTPPDVVIFQKNATPDYNMETVAWKVIQNCGRNSSHPFQPANDQTLKPITLKFENSNSSTSSTIVFYKNDE